jgi:MFS family permease
LTLRHGARDGGAGVESGSTPGTPRTRARPEAAEPVAGPPAPRGMPLPGRSLAALLLGTALVRVGASGVTVGVQLYLADLAHGHPRGLVIGGVGASEALTEMVMAPIMARYADRFGRKLFLAGGPLVGAMSVVLIAASLGPRGIFAARLFEGIAAAAFVPTALGMIAAATSSSVRIRAQASGAFEAATLCGYAGGFAVAPFAYHYFGRGAFAVLALAYLLAGIVCTVLVPRVRPQPVTRMSLLVRAVTGPGPMRSFLPAWLGTFGLLGAYGANLASLLHHAPVAGQHLVVHLDTRVISVVLVAGILLLVAGIVLWTPWIPRLGPVTQMRRAVPGVWLFSAVLLCANHLPAVLLPVLLPLAGLGVVWLAGFGPAAVTFLADCSESYDADRAALMSFYTATLAAGGAIGALLGGAAVYLGSLDGLVVFGALLAVMTFLFLQRVTRYDRAGLSLVPPG